MTDLGVAIFVTTIGLSFLLAVVIGFVRIDPWVRASLVSLVIMRIFALPFIARPQIDIEAAYWFGVALLAFGAWLVGVLVGVVARALLRRIATVLGIGDHASLHLEALSVRLRRLNVPTLLRLGSEFAASRLPDEQLGVVVGREGCIPRIALSVVCATLRP
jgi:hypothetical protein